MHKIQSFPITRESFEMDDYQAGLKIPITQKYANVPDDLYFEHDDMVDTIINYMEALRQEYNSIIEALKLPQGDPDYVKELQARANQVWKELIRWLPESWLQTRTVTMNYETVRAMCSPGQRRFHKLNEWSGQDNKEVENFIAWARTLPYNKQFIFTDEYNKEIENNKTPLEKATDALRKIGVKAKNPDGSYRTIAEIMNDVRDVYRKTLAAFASDDD